MDFAPVHMPLALHISKVGKPIDLNPGTFGPAIKEIILDTVRMREFSTDSFFGMGEDSVILVRGSNISSQAYVSMEHGDAVKTMKLRSLEFENCQFNNLEFKCGREKKPRQIFFKLKATSFFLLPI